MKMLFVAGVAMMAAAAWYPTQGTQASQDYAGTEKCLKCHGMRDKKIAEGVKASPLTHALQPASADGAIQADFSNAPIKKSDVAWVLCWNRHEQNYADKDLKLLPATWIPETKSWVERSSVDTVTQCLGCHTVGLNVAKRTWVSNGVGCESCHGPQGEHAKNPLKVKPSVKMGALSIRQQSMVCGQCHSGGSGKDGSAYATGFRPGMDLDKVWNFNSGPQSSGRSQRYNEWSESAHADKVACVTCHDPHNTSGQPRLLRKPIDELCSSCHQGQSNIAQHAPSAKPGDTCATCHMPNSSHRIVKKS